jgi:hypothetical protein
VGGVHVEVEQQGELFPSGMGQQLGLVTEEDALLGRSEEARKLLDQTLKQTRQLHLPLEQIQALIVMGQVAAAVGDPTPVDLLECASPSDVTALVPRLIAQFGRLLQAWPQLVDATRDLQLRGTRLALSVRPSPTAA